ncbi:hypothetical protein D1007_02532 [Hordeum vulgare]|nr:hypothetical protein D1007_02532 [Hordeum vulgare]
MCVPGERRSVPGTKSEDFVLLGARETTVDGGAQGAGDDAGVLVLEEQEREEDKERDGGRNYSQRKVMSTQNRRKNIEEGDLFARNSIIEAREDNNGEEYDEEPFVHRRVVAELPIGMDVLLYAWTGPETLVAKATIISVDQRAPWTSNL